MRSNDLLNRALGGGMLESRELMELNQALRADALSMVNVAKATATPYAPGLVGNPLQGVSHDSSTPGLGEISPLVPQSIQSTLDSLTYTQDDLAIWKMISAFSVQATSTMHEYTLRKSHGSEGLSPFARENRVGGFSTGEYERRTTRMKFLTEVFEVGEVAQHVPLLNVGMSALDLLTQERTISLMKKLEREIVWASSGIDPLAWDGLYHSINTMQPDHVSQANGAVVTPQNLNEILANLRVQPNYANVNTILCTYEQHTTMANQAIPFGRSDLMKGDTRQFYYQGDEIFVGTQGQKIRIQPCMFLEDDRHPRTKPEGDGYPAALTGGQAPAVTQSAGVSGSAWRTNEVGYDYYYIVEAVGDEGTNRSGVVGPFTPTLAGDAAHIEIDDAGIATSGTGSIRFYRLFRAAVATGEPAPANDAFLFWNAGSYARNKSGAGSDNTKFTDLREFMPRAAPMIIGEFSNATMNFVRFIDLVRRGFQIPRVLAEHVALIMSGSFVVKNPKKLWLYKNVGFGF